MFRCWVDLGGGLDARGVAHGILLMDEDSKKWLKAATEDSGEKIEKSAIFMSLFSKSYAKEPLCALQLGIAILLDKPICLMVVEGGKVPEHLKKIAFAIEQVTDTHPDSMKVAYEKIQKKFDALEKKKKKK